MLDLEKAAYGFNRRQLGLRSLAVVQATATCRLSIVVLSALHSFDRALPAFQADIDATLAIPTGREERTPAPGGIQCLYLLLCPGY